MLNYVEFMKILSEICSYKFKTIPKPLICHLIMFCINIFTHKSGVDILTSVTEKQMKIPVIYMSIKYTAFLLTNWNVMFQTVFLGLALTHDALEWLDKQENSLAQKIRYWRCVIFSGLVFPYTCFVTSMFWVLYWIDRELVFPTVYDEIVPWWFNHCVHTNISIVILIETILHARRQPTDKRMELALNGAVGILYAIVYYTIYFLTHRWLYNVFGILTWWQVCLYQVVIWTSTYVFWLLQFPLNRLFHAAETETEKPAKELTEMPIGVTEKANGDVNVANGVKDAKQNVSEFRNAPFSEKSWSLKYRTIREQFENSL